MKGREFFGPKIAGLFVQKIAQKIESLKLFDPNYDDEVVLKALSIMRA